MKSPRPATAGGGVCSIRRHAPTRRGMASTGFRGLGRSQGASPAARAGPILGEMALPVAPPVKVLVDWRQNAGSRSLIAPYSPRAATAPAVATPLRWDEVARAADSGDARSLRFGPEEVLERLRREGDLYAPALGGGGSLPAP